MTFAPCLPGTTGTELTIVGNDLERRSFIATEEPYVATGGGTIRGLAPYDIGSEPVGVDIPGEQITEIRTKPRTWVIPIAIQGADQSEAGLEQAIDDLGEWLPAIEGACLLIWTRADGTQRAISAHYQRGADNILYDNLAVERHAEARLEFKAFYPYWRPVGTTHGSIEITPSNAYFGGSDYVTVTNVGDVRTWPQITVRGSTENVEMSSITTGQVIRMTEVLDATQQVVIDTDKRSREVWLNDVWRPDVIDLSAADMWPLLPGVNHLMFRAFNQDGDARITLRWPILHETC